MMFLRACRVLLLIPALLIASLAPARAEVTAPDVLLKEAMQAMVAELNAHRDDIARDPAIVQRLAEEILLPHVDFITASRQVLGKHWRRASREQKLAFVREFRTLLLRFYSSALAKYLQDHELDPAMFAFAPLRAAADARQVTVRMDLHPPGDAKPVAVNFLMHRSRKGWRVYDLAIDGVSLIATYRSSFAGQIRQAGLDALIARLAEKNARLAAEPAPAGEAAPAQAG